MKGDRPLHSRIGIGQFQMDCPCHICALFRSREEEEEVFLPFVREGFARGERTVLLLDDAERAARQELLAAAGIDSDEAHHNGTLEILPWSEAYLRAGRFDVESMLDLVKDVLTSNKLRGFKRTRVWANMEWALTEAPGVERLALYESRLNYFLPLTGDAVVCAYRLERFPEKIIGDVVRAHPQIFVDGAAHSNPLYDEPDSFQCD